MVSFYEQVYAVVRRIPPGRVTNYGRIARMLWAPQASRAVGYALRNLRHHTDDPAYADIPWQRVVAKDGVIRVAEQGEKSLLQAELLQAEGVDVKPPDYRVDMKQYLWEGLSPDDIGELLEQLERLDQDVPEQRTKRQNR